jgi:pimeloyl-ACP methyl ester carboxylesterase
MKLPTIMFFSPKVILVCASLLAGSSPVAASLRAENQSRSSGYAEVNGTKLYYEVQGKGPAVVLIHGGLVDRRLWDDQMSPLSKRYRVVRYDLRAFGKSASATEPFSHIEDLRALLDFLKIERATLVGLSLGGIIAADFALEYPKRVNLLVLVGAGLRGDAQPPDKAAIEAYQAASRGAEAFVNATMKTSLYAAVRPGTPAYTRLRQMMLDIFKALPTFVPGFWKYPQKTTFERLKDIETPTLVIIGSDDSQTLKNIADTLATSIPGASKEVIAGSSHHPPVEKAKEFNRILLDFLASKLERKK